MYEEAPSAVVAGAVVWKAYGSHGIVLPDGCMDLLWWLVRLLVAGPDTGPHPAGEVPGRAFAGLRLAPGTAPALLRVPASELRDRRVELADLWPGPEVRLPPSGSPRTRTRARASKRWPGTAPGPRARPTRSPPR